jgi:chromosome segregation ATPase
MEDLNLANENSAALQNECLTLKNQLTESQNIIKTLQDQLKQSRQELSGAKNSLEIANKELATASKSFKEYEKERARVEGRLTAQRTLWQVLFAIATGAAISASI